MLKGTVKWFNTSKGYGFIKSDLYEEDIFVHYKHINQPGFKTLDDGENVRFELCEHEKGLRAHNVERIRE